MIKKIYIWSMLAVGVSLQAQNKPFPLSYQEYLGKVSSGNLEYAVEKLNVSTAQADLVAARVFNDPELSVSYFNNENSKLQMGEGFAVGLTQTVTLGKRSAAIGMARSESELTQVLLTDYFRNLQADATLTYLEAIKQQKLYEVKKNAYNNLRQLAESDSVRYTLGKIMEVDAIQSKLEAGILRNEFLQAGTDVKNAYAAMAVMMGTFSTDTLYQPVSELQTQHKDFILSDLIATAVDSRSDLVAFYKNTIVAHKAVKVARRENIPDIDLSVEVGKNARVKNEEAPAPPFTGVTVGVAFPLKFSAMNRGAVHAAKFKEQQTHLQYDQARLQVQTEVLQAYHQYQSLVEQVKHYENGMLQQAKEVLNGKIYSYNRGEVSLLEILNAQRTYDEVQAQYIETLYNYNAALVELEKSAGIWDIHL
ncbi:TolC family protein [Bacteroides sp. GM023]|uniref:TolC family protein n=1 Tax=Bacteroides sp. GM023 TaxID=2723058 RepID=UPI00168A9A23|nr:TolC family protein [Bacteroides sp. GM023]MBD3589700.1 TolC family protein [Bacteroides sp. GM023]